MSDYDNEAFETIIRLMFERMDQQEEKVARLISKLEQDKLKLQNQLEEKSKENFELQKKLNHLRKLVSENGLARGQTNSDTRVEKSLHILHEVLDCDDPQSEWGGAGQLWDYLCEIQAILKADKDD